MSPESFNDLLQIMSVLWISVVIQVAILPQIGLYMCKQEILQPTYLGQTLKVTHLNTSDKTYVTHTVASFNSVHGTTAQKPPLRLSASSSSSSSSPECSIMPQMSTAV